MFSDNLVKTGKRKNVVVVGGGAAGMVNLSRHLVTFSLTDNSPAPQLLLNILTGSR
jgi:NADH dehydrogenase FAD-containing subunit